MDPFKQWGLHNCRNLSVTQNVNRRHWITKIWKIKWKLLKNLPSINWSLLSELVLFWAGNFKVFDENQILLSTLFKDYLSTGTCFWTNEVLSYLVKEMTKIKRKDKKRHELLDCSIDDFKQKHKIQAIIGKFSRSVKL